MVSSKTIVTLKYQGGETFIMNFLNRKIIRPVTFVMVAFGVAIMPAVALAQDIGTSISEDTNIGKVNNLNSLFYWIVNLMKYIGWAGVLIGVFIVLALLVYKLISGDDTETMKKVQGGITRAIIIIVIGILLLGGTFIISQVAGLIGISDAPINLDEGNWNEDGGTSGGGNAPGGGHNNQATWVIYNDSI